MEQRGRVPIVTMSKIESSLRPMELRKRVRHRLAADAVYTWENAQHTYLHGQGVTRDISVNGAFIFSLTCPPEGVVIQLDVLLFPLGSGARTLRLKGAATVLRVEHGSGVGEEGFAVVMDSLSLT
jgi:hypothetical protein